MSGKFDPEIFLWVCLSVHPWRWWIQPCSM